MAIIVLNNCHLIQGLGNRRVEEIQAQEINKSDSFDHYESENIEQVLSIMVYSRKNIEI